MRRAPTADAISSVQNPRVKAAVRLRDRGAREASGLTVVDGAREILRAFASGVGIEEAFVCPELLRTDEACAAADAITRSGARLWHVSATVLERVAFGDRAEGVVALIRIPSTRLADLRLGPDPLLVVVEAVEKPGNLGAIVRSADAAGADGVIVADPRTDPYNPNAIRASLGTIFALPVAVATSGEAAIWLRARGVRLVAARVDAERLYTDADLTGALALVLGSEAHGLAGQWRAPDVEAVRLPMLGIADSLNVAAAAAVLLYEARRQRGAPT